MRAAPFIALTAVAALVAASPAAGAPNPAADDLARGDVALRAAEAERSALDRKNYATKAVAHFEASFGAEPSWRAAAGAMDANLLLGSPGAASGWYWLASDYADYQEPYLAWQKGALAKVFENRAAFTFEYSEAPASVRVGGVGIPAGALERPIALDPGKHVVLATAQSGNTFQGTIDVTPGQVGGRHFYSVQFQRVIGAGEEDPLLGPRRPPKPDAGMSGLQIGMIVGTVALASGIAIGGGYLLFGQDNPRGLDTAEGAAIVITELVVIGAGTAIALLSDV